MIAHNKLVRDRIPDIIRTSGKVPVVKTVRDTDELKQRLLEKLIEEVHEFEESGSIEEIADILEVLQAIVEKQFGVKWEEVRQLQKKKRDERGGFEKGFVLERVE